MMDGLTADEAEQYDRQIRLWGLEAQKRLRTSSVLVVGAGGLGAELCKNIVLAGVRRVTVLDHAHLAPSDVGNRFLGNKNGENVCYHTHCSHLPDFPSLPVQRAQQAVESLQALNPNVTVVADSEPIEEKKDAFFTQFSAVCVTCSSLPALLHIDTVCRDHAVRFFCGDVWGFYGYFFMDLGEHEYAMEVPREVRVHVEATETLQVEPEERTSIIRKCSFPSLQEALSINWSSRPARYFRRTPPTWFIIQALQEFRDTHSGRDPGEEGDREGLTRARAAAAARLRVDSNLIPENCYKFCRSELSPVCAIVGGVLGQEVIKALSGKDEPYQNCFLYDGVNSTGIVEALRP
jgi:ubiquitin-like 1-activating enzyme E1 A